MGWAGMERTKIAYGEQFYRRGRRGHPRVCWLRLWTARRGVVASGGSPRGNDRLVCRVPAAQALKCYDREELVTQSRRKGGHESEQPVLLRLFSGRLTGPQKSRAVRIDELIAVNARQAETRIVRSHSIKVWPATSANLPAKKHSASSSHIAIRGEGVQLWPFLKSKRKLSIKGGTA